MSAVRKWAAPRPADYTMADMEGLMRGLDPDAMRALVWELATARGEPADVAIAAALGRLNLKRPK